jgi:hypothetical protein
MSLCCQNVKVGVLPLDASKSELACFESNVQMVTLWATVDSLTDTAIPSSIQASLPPALQYCVYINATGYANTLSLSGGVRHIAIAMMPGKMLYVTVDGVAFIGCSFILQRALHAGVCV